MQIYPSHFYKAPSVFAQNFKSIAVFLMPLGCRMEKFNLASQWICNKNTHTHTPQGGGCTLSHPVNGTPLEGERGLLKGNILNATQKTAWHFSPCHLGELTHWMAMCCPLCAGTAPNLFRLDLCFITLHSCEAKGAVSVRIKRMGFT